MLNVTGKYVTVFQPRIELDKSERIVFANLSTSKKNTDRNGHVSYENMAWYGRFVGDSFEPAKALRNEDKIDIIKAAIENRYDKEAHKLYVDVTIFEFVLSDMTKGKSKPNAQAEAEPLHNEFSGINGDPFPQGSGKP